MTKSVLTTEQQVASLWSLGGLTWSQLAKRVWHEIDEDNLLGRASELAYSYLLAIFPFLLFLLSLFGLFAQRGIELRTSLLFYFSQVLPPAAYDLLSKTISEVTTSSSGGKLTFGIILTLVSASGGMSSMISALNAAYGIRDARPWYKVRAIALGLTIAISGLVMGALFFVVAGGHVADLAAAKFHLGPAAVTAWRVLQWPAALFLITFAFALIYYYAPNVKEQHWYWITPGSVFGVLLWIAASFGIRAYLHFFNTYSKTYGSLGAVIILLLWFYVTGLAFLIGGEINAEIEHAAAQHGHPEAKAEGEKVSPSAKQAA